MSVPSSSFLLIFQLEEANLRVKYTKESVYSKQLIIILYIYGLAKILGHIDLVIE